LSTDFKKMIELILKERPEIDAENIRELIDEKKRKIGSGYLTDQGALFLVGADLGVSFESVPKVQAGLKDLYIGAKQISVSARILNLYPIHVFLKRSTNEEVKSRILTIYDKDVAVKVKLWDNLVNLPDEIGLQPGDMIKISHAYVRSGLDGKPIITLGSEGTIEIISEQEDSIPDIDSITITVDDVNQIRDNIVIYGKINSTPRISEFNNSRGEIAKSLQMQISNEANTRSLRVIIWNIVEEKIPRVLNIGMPIRLIGVRIKQGNPQYGSGDLEIHGDEGTVLELSDHQSEIEPMLLRVISIGKETEKGNLNCLAVDHEGRCLSIVIDHTILSNKLKPDAMIECMPSRILGTSIIVSKDDSYIRIVDNNSSFPTASKYETKIRDIQVSENPYIIEAIVLQAPNTMEVNTKTRGTVSVTDTLLGDDTGEIRLVGWREHSSSVSELKVGDRIKLTGITANIGKESKVELTMRPYSDIYKIS
jgi:ssDNA-binding replication factor A large subunit